jgi:hypothetical protein
VSSDSFSWEAWKSVTSWTSPLAVWATTFSFGLALDLAVFAAFALTFGDAAVTPADGVAAVLAAVACRSCRAFSSA